MSMYAHVINGSVALTGNLPGAAQRLDTGQWVSNFDQADQATREACGWFPVNEVRPALGPDQVYGAPTYTVNAHDVTATYPVVADAATNINQRTIQSALAAQLAANSPARNAITTNTTFVGIASPSNAQVVAQVKALSNQNNVIIPNLLRSLRLLLGKLDADA